MTEQFLTTIQISKRLCLAETTVRKWIRSGKLPAFKMGNSWRMSESELIRWMEAQK